MEVGIKRTKDSIPETLQQALMNPTTIIRELNNRSLFHFLQYFWPSVSANKFQSNWHIEYVCSELEKVAYRVANRQEREYDMIINVPPGTSKTIMVSIMFPIWCWTKWPWMKFITASYAEKLSFESADKCRQLIKSDEFRYIYPEITIQENKDTKFNFGISCKRYDDSIKRLKEIGGGTRYSTSIGGTVTGFHGDILIIDDPLNPQQASSDIELATANTWMEQTIPTRKTDKAITPTILVMQRLHQFDPTGNMIEKSRDNIKHICIPGEIRHFRDYVVPQSLISNYIDDLLDPNRLPWKVLEELEAKMGQYGYAGQIGQNPTPPGGGMFKVDQIKIVDFTPPANNFLHTVRFWDKAATHGSGDFTVGIKMSSLTGTRWLIEDMVRGQWGSAEREAIIKRTAEADGINTVVWLEQEAGSGGKESVEGTIRNLAGFIVRSERPTGDKVFRADPFSVQVNAGNIMMMKANWNYDLINEFRFFPLGLHDDIVDASSGAWNKLIEKKVARRIT